MIEYAVSTFLKRTSIAATSGGVDKTDLRNTPSRQSCGSWLWPVSGIYLDEMTEETRRMARSAEASPTLRLFARAGYAANGVVHVLIGIVALVIAWGGEGESDPAGAFKTVAAAPMGFAALWLVAVSLWALAIWHSLEGVLQWRARTTMKWGARIGEWGQTVAFVVLGGLAAAVALGSRPDADATAQEVSRGVIAVPGGVYVLGAVGSGVGIVGVVFIVMGVRRSFEKKMLLPEGAIGRIVALLGAIGFVAKGLAFVIIGILLCVAAVRVDPTAAGGLDAAVAALVALPTGPWLAGAVGMGLILYGVFSMFRARYARL